MYNIYVYSDSLKRYKYITCLSNLSSLIRFFNQVPDIVAVDNRIHNAFQDISNQKKRSSRSSSEDE